MDEALLERLTALEAEHESVLEQLADPDALGDSTHFRTVSIRHGELRPVVEALRAYRKHEADLRDADEMLADESDSEMRDYLTSVAR